MKENKVGLWFMLIGQLALWAGLVFGTIGSVQFLDPEIFEVLPFFKSRPLHVSLVIAWIFLTAVGGIYYYLPMYSKIALYSPVLAKLHLGVFVLTGIAIIGSYLIGKFGGREYWAFPPVLAIPIILSWVMLGVNYFKTIIQFKGKWPVYYWMWATGIVFFFLTYLEANSWVIPYFRGNLIRELSVQWKAYGSLVGSWNMLVYGTSIFIMHKISGDDRVANSKLSFLMYFLGLTNLMFGWAHHIYIVPTEPWVRIFAYAISMTEWVILFRIIWTWKSTLTTAQRLRHRLPFLFLIACDWWIFINLTLALLISIPAINLFTHGTHITVAHTMGSTIGINSMILLASIFFVLRPSEDDEIGHPKTVIAGFWITNISLAVFFVCLLIAGMIKGQSVIIDQVSHQEILDMIKPYMMGFGTAGFGLLIGFSLILSNSIKGFWGMLVGNH